MTGVAIEVFTRLVSEPQWATRVLCIAPGLQHIGYSSSDCVGEQGVDDVSLCDTPVTVRCLPVWLSRTTMSRFKMFQVVCTGESPKRSQLKQLDDGAAIAQHRNAKIWNS